MRQHTATTAPGGWEVAVLVDSRLEADLAVRMLAGRSVEAVVVQRGSQEFAVYVAEDDRATATAVLDVK